MTREQFEAFMKVLIEPLGIDSVTLYTPDPWGIDDSYRLLWMYGVRDEAPMFGPVQLETMRSRLLDQPQRSLCFPTIRSSDLFRRSAFAERENMASVIRFHLLTRAPWSVERPGGILFFGYRKRQGFEVEYSARVDVAASAVEALITQLGELPLSDPASLARHTKALAQIGRATRLIMGESDVDKAIRRVLETVIKITDAGEHSYCCIELIQPNGRDICCEYRILNGAFEKGVFRTAKLSDPGIITSVAQNRRPLVLNDLPAIQKTDKYHYLIAPDLEGQQMLRELAVPMQAKGRLIGVLNLETPQLGTFGLEDVRVTEMLADAATLAIFESRFRERVKWLMQYSIDPGQSLSSVISEITTHVKQHVDADASELWSYANGQFSSAQQEQSSARPRTRATDQDEGLTEWLLVDQYPLGAKAVIVSNIDHQRRMADLDIVKQSGGAWKIEHVGVDKVLNPNLDPNVRTEIGLPLAFHGKLRGVLWVKWKSDRIVNEDEIETLDRFANLASLAFTIAEIVEEPLDTLYQHALRSVFSEERACTLGSSRQLLEPKWYPKVTVLLAELRVAQMVTSPGAKRDNSLLSVAKEFHSQSRDIVHRHGGAITSLLGGRFSAVFGAPEEETEAVNHIQRAALAAAALADCFNSRLPDWKQTLLSVSPSGLPADFGLGIGLYTGWAFVGSFADDWGLDFTAIGEAPTVAYYLQEMARADMLSSVWPRDLNPGERAIVLCPTELSKSLKDTDLALVPLNSPHFRIEPLDRGFSLGVLHRKTSQIQRSARHNS